MRVAGSASVGEIEVQTVAEALSAEVAVQCCRVAQILITSIIRGSGSVKFGVILFPRGLL